MKASSCLRSWLALLVIVQQLSSRFVSRKDQVVKEEAL
jgi:hypothetical protein